MNFFKCLGLFSLMIIISISMSVCENPVPPPQVNAETPTITSQPAGATVLFNASYSLSVTASVTDGGELTYRWYSNTIASTDGGTPIVNYTAASASYVPPTDADGTYYYFVEVTNTIKNNGDGGNKNASIRSNAVILIVDTQVHAQTPIITSHPESSTVIFNALHDLSVEASVTDGGELSYRWYASESESNIDGTHIVNATTNSFNPHTGTAGTHYYFVEVINTIEDNGDSGNKTALVRSNAIEIRILEPSTITISLDAMSEWELIDQIVQVTANTNRVFSVNGTYSTYRWYRNRQFFRFYH